MASHMNVLMRRKREIEKKIKDLTKELSDIEKVLKAAEEMAAKLTQTPEPQAKKAGSSGSQRVRSGARPAQVVAAAKQILSSAAAPMTRSELLDKLRHMNVQIVGANPANTLGTTLSRHKDIFRNIEGFGYWLTDKPYGPFVRPADEEKDTGAGAVH